MHLLHGIPEAMLESVFDLFTQLPRAPHSPCGQLSDIQRAHDAGFDAHLLKPAMFEDVMSTVVRLTAQ